jgi:ATP-dependent DNA helicase RecQ
MDKRYEILQEYFGHNEFRSLQLEAIDAILNKQDLLMVLPTGGGKSLCYQLPSLMSSGVSVVISPLLALMHDQVTALKSNGITAAMISSMQDFDEISKIEKRLKKGSIKILYVAPERLSSTYFLELLKSIDINFFVIDEAHCVSEWGHEFREDYRKLSLLKEHFPHINIAAFTATATNVVQKDIITNLRLQNPLLLKGTIFRKNLTINIINRIKDGRVQLLEFLKQHQNQSGIIYTLSRKSTESVASFLQSKGIEARCYHAGLPTAQKNQTYKDFIDDKVQIVVATIAFGMGIDKSNIRFVVHLNMPKTIENYYQEIGRAGRDGLEATTLLLHSIQDTITHKSFIDELPDTPYKLHAMQKIDAMSRFVNYDECRHKSLAKYFDDMIDSCNDKCDNCLQTDIEKTNITKASQMLLSAVYKTGQNYGMFYIIDILRGSKEQRIIKNHHDRLSVYGIGDEYTKNQWHSISDKLLEIGALSIGEFKVYKLTPTAIDILKSKQEVFIKSDRLEVKKVSQKKKVTYFDDYDVEMFDKLRELRNQIARDNAVPPYVVFSDKTLKELSQSKPQSKEQMLLVHGIGEVKFQKYGKEFLNLCVNL